MTLTGVAIIDFKGNGPNWKWDGVDLWIDISGPLAATGRQAAPQKILGFQVDQWAPFASLNSIYDDRTAVNAGFAVDSFSVLLVNTGTERIPNVFGIADQYRQTGTLHVNAAVRDIDAWLYRIGYCVNLLGRPVEYTPQPI
jgi:hypothetical protein